MASESSSAASVEESISQTAELNLASSSCAETDVKDSAASSSEAAKKTEIPMPSGPKTRQALEFEISKLTNYFLSYMWREFRVSVNLRLIEFYVCVFLCIF